MDKQPDRQILFDLKALLHVWQAEHGEKTPAQNIAATLKVEPSEPTEADEPPLIRR